MLTGKNTMTLNKECAREALEACVRDRILKDGSVVGDENHHIQGCSMSWLKKVKDKLKIGLGAIAVAVLGASGIYWSYEKINYAHNVLDLRGTSIGAAVFVGDTGQKGKHLDAVVSSMRKLCPKTAVVLGDLQYPSGPASAEDFAEYLTKPFNELCPGHLFTFIVQGNHSQYAFRDREWAAKNMFDRRAIGRIYYPNYYYGVIFDDVCLLALETSVYDVKVGDPKIQKRQEKFAEKFLEDGKCFGKRKIAFGHHPIYSSGQHGDAGSGDFKDFYKKTLKGKVEFYIAGHDHNLSYEKCEDKTCHVVSGSGSKIRECIREDRTCVPALGYFVYDRGLMKMEVLK